MQFEPRVDPDKAAATGWQAKTTAQQEQDDQFEDWFDVRTESYKLFGVAICDAKCLRTGLETFPGVLFTEVGARYVSGHGLPVCLMGGSMSDNRYQGESTVFSGEADVE